jgi:hypothetical protein
MRGRGREPGRQAALRSAGGGTPGGGTPLRSTIPPPRLPLRSALGRQDRAIGSARQIRRSSATRPHPPSLSRLSPRRCSPLPVGGDRRGKGRGSKGHTEKGRRDGRRGGRKEGGGGGEAAGVGGRRGLLLLKTGGDGGSSIGGRRRRVRVWWWGRRRVRVRRLYRGDGGGSGPARNWAVGR